MKVPHITTDDLSNGVLLIGLERLRQVEDEGWTPEHDDEHGTGDLCNAARCYLIAALHIERGNPKPSVPPPTWPWHDDWWKPADDPERNLVKAGALIAAELDRLHRRGTADRCPKCGGAPHDAYDCETP